MLAAASANQGMRRTSFRDRECPIARAADILGHGWHLLVLRELLRGVRGYVDIQLRTAIPPRTLSRCFDELGAFGLVERRSRGEGARRYDYLPTPAARALLPILVAMGMWANHWLVGAGEERMVFVNTEDECPVEQVLVDRRTGRPLDDLSLALRPGPRASDAFRALLEQDREALPGPPS